MTVDDIEKHLVSIGGICKTHDNHFGGDPNVTPKLNLQIQQRPKELARLIHFFMSKKEAGEQLDYYAEIGACSGGTTRAIYEYMKFKELLILDDGGAISPDFYVNHRGDQLRGQNLNFIPRIEVIGSSAEQRVIDIVHNLTAIRQYDILFIDGDHSYEGVKKDTINYLKIVRTGGYVVFHDTVHLQEIVKWLSEIPSVLPNLVFVGQIAESDPYTPAFPNGIGLSIYQKT